MNELLLSAAFVALLQLDTVSIGQWMISRPIVVGPLVGAFVGEPQFGALMGAALELFLIDALPMGGVIPVNGAIAAGSAVLLASGTAALPPGVSLIFGLLLGRAWIPVESGQRRRRASWAKGARRPGAIIFKSVFAEFLIGTGFVFAGVFIGEWAGLVLEGSLPRLLSALDFAVFFAVAAVSLSNLVLRLRPGRVG